MRARGLDVELGEPLVESDRGSEALHQIGYRFTESSDHGGVLLFSLALMQAC